MTRHPIRVGVIGAGNFARECHIPGVQAHPQGEVVAMCSRNDDPGFTDGLYTQKAIDAAIQSAREQRWVTV